MLFSGMNKIAPETLFTEIEQILRLMPKKESLHHENIDILQWIGRASAAVEAWASLNLNNITTLVKWQSSIDQLHAFPRIGNKQPHITIITILFQIQRDLQLQTIGPLSVNVGPGEVFQYFDEVRKIIEQASSDILFVDPYLNADFISRYLPHVKSGINIRLLSQNNVSGLKAAAELFSKENNLLIEIRLGSKMHDRWLFIDRARCFQSGASFKDGGFKAGTTLTENIDTFTELHKHYEQLWELGKIS